MDRAYSICGLVFSLVGAVFTALGVSLAPMLLRQSMAFLAFPVLGIVFLALGLSLLIARARHRRMRAAVLENGQCIWADIIEIGYDTGVEVNGRNPLVLRCQAVNPADGKVYVFTSEGLWFDPAPFLGERRQVPVYVDPENYHHYAVDLDGILPEQG